jgi:hypothetical protein
MGFTVMCLHVKCLKPDVEVSVTHKKADFGRIMLKPC